MGNRRIAFAIVLSFIVAACGVSTGWADEVTYWNQVALEIMKQSATHPPKVGRDLAIMHSAMYDALNAIEGTHYPLFYEPSVTGPASQESAVAAAAHQALVNLYPAYAASLNQMLNTRLAAIPDGAAKSNGIALGQSVADNMLALRASDGSNLTADYPGSTTPGQWRPTPPGYKPGLAPLWGNVTPFSIPSADDFRPGPPPALTSPEYAAAVEQTKELGAFQQHNANAGPDPDRRRSGVTLPAPRPLLWANGT